MPRSYADRLPEWERAAFIKDREQTCQYCGAEGDRWKVNDRPWEIDHVIPMRFGGAARDWSNLALACHECNIIKGTMALDALPDLLSHGIAMLAHREKWPA